MSVCLLVAAVFRVIYHASPLPEKPLLSRFSRAADYTNNALSSVERWSGALDWCVTVDDTWLANARIDMRTVVRGWL